MSLHFVTGPAGAGKTAVVGEFQARRYRRIRAYDTDDQHKLHWSAWMDRATGTEFAYYNEMSHDELNTRRYRWGLTALGLGQLSTEAYMYEVFLCGRLEQPEPALQLVHDNEGEIVFLEVTDDTIRSRLQARRSDPDAPLWGRTDAQIDASIAQSAAMTEYFRERGAVMLDANRPVDEVVEGILRVTA